MNLPVSLRIVSVGVVCGALLALAPVGCSSDRATTPTDVSTKLSREELIDPETCAGCHPKHVQEWSGSMHAYAAEDPIFIAMNARFLRDSKGAQPDFCVRCHAPLAVADGRTTDGRNLAELPKAYRGVTCFFCHNVSGLGALHNNSLVLSSTPTMFGPIKTPVDSPVHESAYSALLDGSFLNNSAALCGSCHDVVTPSGAEVERTFKEWAVSAFVETPCNGCHMKRAAGADEPIATYPGAPARPRHVHTFAGVDRAITPFPNESAQAEEIQTLLDNALQASVCVSTQGGVSRIRVLVSTVETGHSFPSGAVSDRRLWFQMRATVGDEVILESGVVADGEAVTEGPHDPNVWLLNDHAFTPSGSETHQFAEASCYTSKLLPATRASASEPRLFFKDYGCPDGPCARIPDKVSLQPFIMPVAVEVLNDLVASGDLAPDMAALVRPIPIGRGVTWTPTAVDPSPVLIDDVPYFCVASNNQNFRLAAVPLPTLDTCSTK